VDKLSVQNLVNRSATPLAGDQPAAVAEAAPAGDPHDKSDTGASHWRDDPLFWTVALIGFATGIIGFRFHWGPGVSAGARVDIGDETASMLGHALFTIGVILVVKVLASKVPVKGIQAAAAAI